MRRVQEGAAADSSDHQNAAAAITRPRRSRPSGMLAAMTIALAAPPSNSAYYAVIATIIPRCSSPSPYKPTRSRGT
jgi:hypothetical protein